MAPRKKRVSTIKAENDKGQKRKIKEENEDDDKDSGVSSMSPEPESPKLENVEESDSDDELCEYEKIRKRNIAERQRKLAELNLIKLASDLSSAMPGTSKKIASRRGLSAPKKEKENLPLEPVRKSLRLQNIDADTGLTLPEKEPTRYHIIEDDWVARPPLTDLTLEEITNEDKYASISDYFKDSVEPFVQDKKTNMTSAGSKSIFENTKSLAKSLKTLKIKPELVAKVVPTRIFSLDIHPTESKVLVAAGGKWGSIGFWDVSDNTSEMHGVQVIKPHTRPINCLTFDKYDQSRLVSTSYDGSVRLFDINEQKSSVIFGLPEDSSSYITYHSQIDQHCFLITLGKSGTIGLVDTRVSNNSTTSNYKIFEKASPKTVSVHPVQTEYFLSPNNKGACGIFDRRMNKSSKVMTPVASLIGHTKAISSAFFSSQTGNKAVTVAYDNKIRIFDTENLNQNTMKPYKSITHNNQTGRWLTTFKAEFHPRIEQVFFCGSMNRPRQIDCFTTEGDQFNLKGDDLASVCSIVKCHPTQDIVVGGNSSGRVHVFM